MIQRVEMFNSLLAPEQQRVTVSVEIEKTREPLYQLFPHGDLVRPSAQATPTLARWSFVYLFSFLQSRSLPVSCGAPPRCLSVRTWRATLASGRPRRP